MTVASFREIPKIVADNWRAIDPITKMFMEAVASILKERYAQFPDCVKTLRKTIKKNKRSLSPVDSSSKEPSLTKSLPDNSLPVMSNSEQVISLPVAVSPTSFLNDSAEQNLFTGYNVDSVPSTMHSFCQEVGTLDSYSSSKEPSLTKSLPDNSVPSAMHSFCQEVGTLDSWSFDFSRQMPYQDKAARRFSEVTISDREIIGYWVSAD